MVNDFKIAKNFNLREFDCPHCNCVKLDPLLVDKLQKLRDRFGRPVYVVSGYRCPAYNRAVGGAFRSYHVRGKAADIKIPDVPLERICTNAREVGFKGIKAYYQLGFVHLDLRTWRWHRW